VIGHSDQIASTSVICASHACSASVRTGSPTSAMPASSRLTLIAHATAAFPNSRHS
jgi:hypothetical protein